MRASAAILSRRVVVFLVLGVLLAEGVARFALGLGTPPLSIPHPTIEYMFKPNQDLARFGNRVAINQFGMRSDPLHEKAPGELRILVFGDSVVNGGSLTDQGALATSILQRNLAQGLKRPVVVGNVSAGSWGPGNWLAYAQEFGFFSSDVVVLVVSSHDVTDVPTFEPLDPMTHPTERPFVALQELFQRYLPQQLAARGWINRGAAAATPSAAQLRRLRAVALGDLRTFLQLAQASAPTVLVLQHLENGELAQGMVQQGHADVREVTRSVGLVPVSLGPAFQRSVRAGSNPYRDGIHPNDEGQRLIVAAIASTFASASYASEPESTLEGDCHADADQT